jgi:hypothetical protein
VRPLQPEKMSEFLLNKPKYLKIEIMKYLTQIITSVRHIPIFDAREDLSLPNVPPFSLSTDKLHASIPFLR